MLESVDVLSCYPEGRHERGGSFEEATHFGSLRRTRANSSSILCEKEVYIALGLYISEPKVACGRQIEGELINHKIDKSPWKNLFLGDRGSPSAENLI